MLTITRISSWLSSPTAGPLMKISSALKDLWAKVSHATASFFANFSCFHTVKNVFSKKEITLLRSDQTIKVSSHEHRPLDQRDVKPVKPLPHHTSEAGKTSPEEPPYVVFDDSLEDMRAFLRSFSDLSVDTIYENHLASRLESAQNMAPSLPPALKSLAKLLVEVGDKAAKPIFQKFAQQKAHVIDPALQKIFKTLLKPDTMLLRDKLAARMNEKLAHKALTHNLTANDYIAPILQWLACQDGQRKPILDQYPEEKNFDHALVDSLLSDAVSFWANEQDRERRILYDSLEQQLVKEFKDFKAPARQNIQRDFIQPILAWLLLSDHTTPLAELFGPGDRLKEDLIDNIFERAIASLVEKKIDQYVGVLEKTLQRRLGEITHHMLCINANRVVDFFSERISDLIASMPYTETYDALVRDVGALHIKGIIEAEKHLAVDAKLLEKAQHTAKIDPKNPEEIDSKARAQSHLNFVASQGGDKAFLQNVLIEKYSQQPICSENIRQIIDQQINPNAQNADPFSNRKTTEKAIFSAIAENILELMTPTKRRIGANGDVEEVDPFSELWDRLYFPEELQELLKHGGELAEEFITPDTLALLEKIKSPTIEMARNIFKSTTKEILKKHLISIVETSFERLTSPESLDEMHAKITLPAINTQLVKFFMKEEIGQNLSKFAPLFHKLVTEDAAALEMNLRNIQIALIKQTKGAFQEFDPKNFYAEETYVGESAEVAQTPFSEIEWLNLSRSIVKIIIRDSQINGTSFDPAKTKISDIKDILSKYFQQTSKENDPIYGELTLDVLFKLGDLPHEGVVSFFAKDALSAAITGNAAQFRSSHHFLVATVTDALKESLLNPKRVKELLSTESSPKPVFTKERLEHQIGVTSRIAYDLLMRMAEQKGAIVKYAAKKIISTSPEEIQRQISLIYKKLIGNKLINENLIVVCCEEVFRSLAVASENVRMRDNTRVYKLSA